MIYTELGRYPLDIVIKTRIIGFWNRLLFDKQTKISLFLYNTLRTMTSTPKWIANVKNILGSVGRSNLWMNQDNIETLFVRHIVKQTLVDQFLQKWHCNTEIIK